MFIGSVNSVGYRNKTKNLIVLVTDRVFCISAFEFSMANNHLSDCLTYVFTEATMTQNEVSNTY